MYIENWLNYFEKILFWDFGGEIAPKVTGMRFFKIQGELHHYKDLINIY